MRKRYKSERHFEINCQSFNQYDRQEKMFSIFEVAADTYSNMRNRLHWREKFANFVLVYYSLCLIVYAITTKYFPLHFSSDLSEYFSIILSVLILAYSLINNNARYSIRIMNVEKSMNSIKTLKRDLNVCNVELLRKEYNIIRENTEVREEVDFFRTVKQKCKKNDVNWYIGTRAIRKRYSSDDECKQKEIKKILDYLSDLNPIAIQIQIFSEFIWNTFVVIVPVAIFVTCFLVG